VAIRTFLNMLGEMSGRAHFDTAEARDAGTVYRAGTAGRPGLIGVPSGGPSHPTDHHPDGVPERALLLRATGGRRPRPLLVHSCGNRCGPSTRCEGRSPT
jgi:hypothetical protein